MWLKTLMGKHIFKKNLGFFATNSKCVILAVKIFGSPKMQHYTLCHGKQIAQTFFPRVLFDGSLPCHFATDTSIAQINHHGWWFFSTPTEKVGAGNYLPKRGDHLCAIYTSLLQVLLTILCKFTMIILYLYYSSSKRYQHVTARPSEVLFGCLTPGLWLLCSAWSERRRLCADGRGRQASNYTVCYSTLDSHVAAFGN